MIAFVDEFKNFLNARVASSAHRIDNERVEMCFAREELDGDVNCFAVAGELTQLHERLAKLQGLVIGH